MRAIDRQANGRLKGRNKSVFATLDALKDEILSRDERNFISRYLFETVPFIFQNDIEAWVSWKTELGRLIDVDPRDIVLTGSSAIGYSLNPYKSFRAFDENSDIDCGIVSYYHFDVAWRYLRQQRVEWLTLPSEVKDAIKMHAKNYIFSGTIATDRILSLLPYGKSWLDALEAMSHVEPTVGREVKLRIYKDFDALRGYQSMGVKNAKGRCLIDRHEDVHEIPTEDL
jgi:hypothetical protein